MILGTPGNIVTIKKWFTSFPLVSICRSDKHYSYYIHYSYNTLVNNRELESYFTQRLSKYFKALSTIIFNNFCGCTGVKVYGNFEDCDKTLIFFLNCSKIFLRKCNYRNPLNMSHPYAFIHSTSTHRFCDMKRKKSHFLNTSNRGRIWIVGKLWEVFVFPNGKNKSGQNVSSVKNMNSLSMNI